MSRAGLVGSFFVALVLLAPSFAAHDSPDATGTWHVGANETVTKEDQASLTACNVTVEDGGRLTLRHSTLTMACLDGSTPTLTVRAGGVLVLDENGGGGTTIQSAAASEANFPFLVEGTLQATGATITGTQRGVIFQPSATNSFLRDCTIRLSGESGVEVVGTRGVTIENSRITDNPTGFGLQIRGRGAAPLVRQNTITSPGAGSLVAFAVDVSFGASPRLEGNTISGGALGAVRWNESSGSFVSNTVHAGRFTALLIDQRSTVEVRNNLLDGGDTATVQVRGSTPLIEGNTIASPVGQRIALRIQDSAATVRRNVIEETRLGVLAIYSDGLVIEHNTFRDVDDAGILCGDGAQKDITCGRHVVFANNTVSGATDGIIANMLEGVIRDNVLHDNDAWGILALNRRPTVLRNSLSGNGEGGVIVAHDVKIRVLDSAGSPVGGAKVTLRDATGDLDPVEGTTGGDGYVSVSRPVGPAVSTFRIPDYQSSNEGARTDHNPYAITVEKSGMDTETFTYPVVTSSPVVLRLGKKPDLVGVVELAEEDLVAGERVPFDVRVTNAGSGDAGNVVVTFYVDSQRLGARTIDTLAAGKSAAERFEWTATKGNHLALAVLDPENRIVEGDEANNRAELVLAVQEGDGTPPPDDDGPPPDDLPVGERPDLTLSAPVLSKARNIVEGDVLAVLATVTNAGLSASAGTTVTLLDGLDAVDEFPIRGLGAGESWPVSTQWRASAGHHNLTLVVDADGAVAEANEGNNRAGRDVEVAEADPGANGGGLGGDTPAAGFGVLILAVLAALASARRGRAGR